MLRVELVLLLALCPIIFNAQEISEPVKPQKKLTFYGSWGYNRWTYTKSTIHFKNAGEHAYTDPTHGPYDFTLYNAVAHDSPDFNQIAGSWSDVVNLTIPQFSVRVGFYMNNRNDEGWEINYDHAKYVVDDNQKMHIKGTILGEKVDKDTVMQHDYFHFEHTDGANFWQLNYIKRWKVWANASGKSNIGFIFKPGAGVVIPRTDCTIFGSRLNNRWHVAGFITGIETGMRAECNHWFLEFTGKVVYADYLWCFVHYQGNGNANHRFGAAGAILSLGYQFNCLFPAKKS